MLILFSMVEVSVVVGSTFKPSSRRVYFDRSTAGVLVVVVLGGIVLLIIAGAAGHA